MDSGRVSRDSGGLNMIKISKYINKNMEFVINP